MAKTKELLIDIMEMNEFFGEAICSDQLSLFAWGGFQEDGIATTYPQDAQEELCE